MNPPPLAKCVLSGNHTVERLSGGVPSGPAHSWGFFLPGSQPISPRAPVAWALRLPLRLCGNTISRIPVTPTVTKPLAPVGYHKEVGPPLPKSPSNRRRVPAHPRPRGLLHTPHGVIETPVFMPVGTQPPSKVSPSATWPVIWACRFCWPTPIISTCVPGMNSSGIWRTPQVHVWPNAILTDSVDSSVQPERPAPDRRGGRDFPVHLDGDRHTFTPESTVDVQLAFGSDILMVLDECPSTPSATNPPARACSGRCAGRSRRTGIFGAAWPKVHPARPLPIVQGSMFPDLRRECATALAISMPRATPSAACRWASRARLAWKPWRPPKTSCRAVSRATPWAWHAGGIARVRRPRRRHDGCVLPSRNARNGYCYLRGRVIVKHARYKDDARPLDPKCPAIPAGTIPGLLAPSLPGGEILSRCCHPAQYPTVP